MVTFKEVTPYEAIKEVFKHKKNWDLLYECIDNSKEVIEENGKIYFDTSYTHLYYINDKDYVWIAGYDENKLCFLQLVHKPYRNNIELVIAQKRSTTKTKNWFKSVVDYIKVLYPQAKTMTTLPLNDKLKEYYKQFGFNDYKHGEIRLNIA